MSVVIKSQTADETVYKVTGLGPKLEVEIVIQNNKFSKTYDSIPPKDIVQGIEEITQLFQAILALQQQQIWKTLSASGKLFLLEQIEKSMALKCFRQRAGSPSRRALLNVADNVKDDVEIGKDAEVEANDSLKSVQAVAKDDSKQSLEKDVSATSAATASAKSDDKQLSHAEYKAFRRVIKAAAAAKAREDGTGL
ncbi:hypothetical protein NBRC10513_000802 [Rhodotorula toruloides]|uniref:FGENESH: predicted gene_13.263 protein n=1 Tax=Rhodotorula toruloides TaxID=5286 RepID=A0A0K3CPE3_RHOTO